MRDIAAHGERRRRWGAGICVSVPWALACALGLLAGCGGDGGEAASRSADPLAAIDRASLVGRPVAVTVSGRIAWLLTRDPNELLSARVVRGKVALRSWPLSRVGADVAVAGGRVWVAYPGIDKVVAYRSGRREAAVKIPAARRLAAGGRRLWVLTGEDDVQSVDPQSGRRSGPAVSLPDYVDASRVIAATAAGDAWVGDLIGNLARVSARTMRVDRFLRTESGGFSDLVLTGGRLWAPADYGGALGVTDADGRGKYVNRRMALMGLYLGVRPDAGLVVAGGSSGEVETYGLDGKEGPALRLGDIGPIAVDTAGTVWVTQPHTRRLVALRESGAGTRARPRVRIEEAAGTVDGVGLGDRPGAVIKRLGEPAAYSDDESVLPLQASEDLNSGPSQSTERYEVKPRGYPALRYDDAFYLVCARTERCAGRVAVVVVTGPRAETSRGVAIGDSLDRAREEYDDLSCYDFEPTTSEDNTGPYCTGRVGAGRYMLFVGDPIGTIELRAFPVE